MIVREAWARRIAATQRPLPTGGMFSPGNTTLDPRIFDIETEQMRDDVRTMALATIDAFWTPRYGNWQGWARPYLCGSAASYWWDSDADFDCLIGIDKGALDRARPQNRVVSEEDVCLHLSKEMKEELDPTTTDFVGGLHATWFVNPDSFDISDIRPYAAYDITNNAWAVHPPKLPRTWGPQDFPVTMWEDANEIADHIERILKRPEPERTMEGVALFGQLHALRQRSYRRGRDGWMDFGNFAWQALSQWHVLQPLYRLVHPELATITSGEDE